MMPTPRKMPNAPKKRVLDLFTPKDHWLLRLTVFLVLVAVPVVTAILLKDAVATAISIPIAAWITKYL